MKGTRRPPQVISTDANPLGVGGAILIYIYVARSREKATVPKLLRSQLLLPPIMTNKLPWVKGYFEFVENRPLGPADRLHHHCFKDIRGGYFDERGNRLPGPVEPVGQWGLHTFRTMKALGIPLAPEG